MGLRENGVHTAGVGDRTGVEVCLPASALTAVAVHCPWVGCWNENWEMGLKEDLMPGKCGKILSPQKRWNESKVMATSARAGVPVVHSRASSSCAGEAVFEEWPSEQCLKTAYSGCLETLHKAACHCPGGLQKVH